MVLFPVPPLGVDTSSRPIEFDPSVLLTSQSGAPWPRFEGQRSVSTPPAKHCPQARMPANSPLGGPSLQGQGPPPPAIGDASGAEPTRMEPWGGGRICRHHSFSLIALLEQRLRGSLSIRRRVTDPGMAGLLSGSFSGGIGHR